jgi:hypothetical protein
MSPTDDGSHHGDDHLDARRNKSCGPGNSPVTPLMKIRIMGMTLLEANATNHAPREWQ